MNDCQDLKCCCRHR
jgi:hypothetical protein